LISIGRGPNHDLNQVLNIQCVGWFRLLPPNLRYRWLSRCTKKVIVFFELVGQKVSGEGRWRDGFRQQNRGHGILPTLSPKPKKRLEFLALELRSEATQLFEFGRVEKLELLRPVKMFESKVVE
jgi:hypothetical protein